MPDPVRPLPSPALALALVLAFPLALTGLATAQAPPSPAVPAPAAGPPLPGAATIAEPDPGGDAPSPGNVDFDDPYAAYQAGAWEQALQGFVDQQIEHPEDPEVALNLGSVHYEMRNFEEADRAFASAALAGDAAIRSQAFYNLGNSAYRQGRLPEAVELYKRALELAPDDEDAKYNLELVRDEIRRRHEEAQKRQQEGQQQQQQQQQEQGQDQQDQDQQGQQDGSQQQGEPQPQDSDGDGLGDEQERSAENPTDPANPDSDGDGLPDGQEDQNRNGRVDEGETDPNNPDSDGDGTGDGEEAAAESPSGQGEAPPEDTEGLTPEEAERYLQSLEEGLPDQQRRLPRGTRAARPEKDW